MSSAEPILRRIHATEYGPARTLIWSVVVETYGDLGRSARSDIDLEDVAGAWVLCEDNILVGIALTADAWLRDLWILPAYRGCGNGMRLLRQAEQEIALREHRAALLRVVKSNEHAVAFYRKAAWRVDAEFPHEPLAVPMLRMRKDLNRTP